MCLTLNWQKRCRGPLQASTSWAREKLFPTDGHCLTHSDQHLTNLRSNGETRLFYCWQLLAVPTACRKVLSTNHFRHNGLVHLRWPRQTEATAAKGTGTAVAIASLNAELKIEI